MRSGLNTLLSMLLYSLVITEIFLERAGVKELVLRRGAVRRALGAGREWYAGSDGARRIGHGYERLLRWGARWRALESVEQCYVLGGGLLLPALLLTLCKVQATWWGAASLLAFATGFVLWVRPAVQRVWSHFLGKVFIAVLHFGMAIIATALARHFVARAIGLPPQDFEMTVSVVTVLCYLPVWAFLVCVGMALATIFWSAIGLLKLLGRWSPGRAARYLAHLAGTVAILMLAANILAFTVDRHAAVYPLVRLIAYACDYQPAPLYPGVAKGERVRLHEHGVMSVATLRSGTISSTSLFLEGVDPVEILVRKPEE